MYKDIFEAASSNNLTAVKRFIEVHGIRPRIKNADGDTVAHIATQNDNVDMLRYLMEIDPDLLHSRGQADSTLLEIAIAVDSLSLVQYLVDDCKVDILKMHCDQPPPDTYVHFAAEMGNLDIFKYFIEKKPVKVDLHNTWGQPPAFAAAREAHLNIVKYIVEERNGDVTVTDTLKRNILCQSAIKSDLTIPRYLLDEKKIRINVNNPFIIHDAISSSEQSKRKNLDEFLKYFIEEKRMNINADAGSDAIPLHRAANAGMLDVVKYLTHHGADVRRKDRMGRTPLEVTTDKEIRRYLEDIQGQRNRRSILEFPSSGIFEPHHPTNGKSTRDVSTAIQNSSLATNITASDSIHSFLFFANTFFGLIFQKYNNRTQPFPYNSINSRENTIAVDSVRDYFLDK